MELTSAEQWSHAFTRFQNLAQLNARTVVVSPAAGVRVKSCHRNMGVQLFLLPTCSGYSFCDCCSVSWCVLSGIAARRTTLLVARDTTNTVH